MSGWVACAARVVAGVVVGAVLVAGCAGRVVVSPEALRERGEREAAILLQRVKVYDDAGVAEYLAAVARRVGGGARVTVIEDPTLGAFGMPGGRVFLLTGLLASLESEAQVALVLARETARDAWTVGERESELSTVAMGPTAAAVLGRDLRLAASAALAGAGSDRERAIDGDALRRLAGAGYDPRAGATVFRRLAAEHVDREELAEVFLYANGGYLAERERVWRDMLGAEPARGGEDGAAAEDFARRMRPLVRDNAALDARAGRFALARRRLQRLLAADPGDAIALSYDGERDRLEAQRLDGPEKAERVRLAIDRYRRAAELNPRYAEPFRQLALLHYQQGDAARAREAFERYLGLAGDTPDARRVREYLAILGP